MSDKKQYTWDELKKLESGTILHDIFDEGIRFIVMRGPAALCGYVGLPKDHPLAGYGYDDLPVQAHYGLTFSGHGKSGSWPDGYWWYGWDYGHCGDRCFYEDELPKRFIVSDEKQWLVEDVVKDSWETMYDIKKLMKLAEKISNQQEAGNG